MDIDTTPPPSHHDGRPTMQLDMPASDDVMMEVDPDLSSMTAPVMTSPNTQANTSFSAQSSPTTSAIASPSQPQINRGSIDSVAVANGPLPVPPVVLVSDSDSPAWPKFKLDQLFVEWLARGESKKWLDALLEDARAGKPPEHLVSAHASRTSRLERVISLSPARTPSAASPPSPSFSPPQAPGSPVSRLISSHIPLGYSDGSPRSPPSGPLGFTSSFRQMLSSPGAAELDLGKSGSASPMSKPSPREFALGAPAKPEESVGAPLKGPSLPSGTMDSALGVSMRPADACSSAPEGNPSEGTDRLLQVPDSKILDRVADGIAGMTAAVDSTPQHIVIGHEPSSGDKEATFSEGKPERTTEPAVQRTVPDISSPDSREKTREHSKDVNVSPPVAEESSLPLQDVEGAKSVAISTPEKQVVTITTSTAESEEDIKKHHVTPLKDADMEVTQSMDNEKPSSPVTHSKGRARKEKNDIRNASGMPPTGARVTKHPDAVMAEAYAARKRKALPRFYFPCGKDAEARERKEKEVIKEFFRAQRTQKSLPGVNRTDIAELVVEVIGLPSYFAGIIFNTIQELFSTSTEGANTGYAASPDPSKSGTSHAREESSMKDVGHSDEEMRTKSRQQETQCMREDSGATNSDTTMGDVNDAASEDGRANGFTSPAESRGVANSSAAAQRSPSLSGEGNSTPNAPKFDLVTEEQFVAHYEAFCKGASKEARLFNALKDPKTNRDYLIPSDFKPLLRALLLCHQGLAFLHQTPEFQQRYSETVIERIYFGCTRQHNGRLSLNDIRRSKLLDTLMVVDEEEDINRERKYFSYEHFYVLYCRFWELDANHDLQIDREDLMRYGSHSLTYRIVDRIFGGYARPLDCPDRPGYMSYTDFIWFCLSEEDKTSDTAIDYWFRCIDMDGDGLITMYDMEFFYKEQLHRMECFGHEPVQIRDILCQLLDMINPNVKPPVIRRRDLRLCRLAGNFFNVLFNLNKFFAIEARDPLQIRQEHATPELTDWDRFAALEYLRLSAEEEGEEDESWEDVGEATNPLMAGEAPF